MAVDKVRRATGSTSCSAKGATKRWCAFAIPTFGCGDAATLARTVLANAVALSERTRERVPFP
jgi:hypothetical protein